MTNILREMVQCAVCGNESEQGIIRSSNTVGSPDLDTRPPESERSTIGFGIQTCPFCGYCASTISEPAGKAAKIVNSGAYQQQRDNPGLPPLAKSYLCYSLLKENAGLYASAGWSSIHAAWICDDANSVQDAEKCRLRAIDLLKRAKHKGQNFAKGVSAEEALMVDLWRRSRQFAEALATCNDGLKRKPAEPIKGILLFQKKVIAKSDAGCYCIEETMASDVPDYVAEAMASDVPVDGIADLPKEELLATAIRWFNRHIREQHMKNAGGYIKVASYPQPPWIVWEFAIPLDEVTSGIPEYIHCLCPKSISYEDFFYLRIPTAFLSAAAKEHTVGVTFDSKILLCLKTQASGRFCDLVFHFNNFSRFLIMAINMGKAGILLETEGALAEKAKTDTGIVKAVIEVAKSDETVKYEALEILEEIGRPPASEFIYEVIKSAEDKYVGMTVTFDREEVVRSWLDWTDLCRDKHRLGASRVFRQAFLSFDFPEIKLMHLYYNAYLYLDGDGTIKSIKKTTGSKRERKIDIFPVCIHRQYIEEMDRITGLLK